MRKLSRRGAAAALVEALPDLPRWVEARGMLLSGEGFVAGGRPSPRGCLVASPELRLIVAVRRPPRRAVDEAAALAGTGWVLLAAPEEAPYLTPALPGWTAEEAVLHTLPDPRRRFRQPPGVDLRVLDNPAPLLLGEIPPTLHRELLQALRRTEVIAAFVDGAPVAFCYAGSVTERWWDVSIDTLEPYRRRGLARACVVAGIRRMRRLGKEPVWGALASNEPSLRLAAKLGFRPVDRLIVFQR